MVNSIQKGKAAEREFSAYLRGYGFEARRGQQFSGGGESPDVVHNIPNVHIEVKRTERAQIYDWVDQAKQDAGGKLPVVAHRRNRGGWLAIIPMENFVALMVRYEFLEKVATGTVSDAEPGAIK